MVAVPVSAISKLPWGGNGDVASAGAQGDAIGWVQAARVALFGQGVEGVATGEVRAADEVDMAGVFAHWGVQRRSFNRNELATPGAGVGYEAVANGLVQ